MDHSQYNGNDYGDATGIMGGADYGSENDEEGKLCFNAPKNYFLGWFSAYNEDLDKDAPVYSGELVPTNDVVSGLIGKDQDHVLKITEGTSCTNTPNWLEVLNDWTCSDYESDTSLCDGYGDNDDAAGVTAYEACCVCGGGSNGQKIFVHYNKVEGVTADIDPAFLATFGNVVTVYTSRETVGAKSQLVAGLSAGQTYTKSNFASTGKNLIIKACSITAGTPDTAKVIVYLEGVTTASCTDPPINNLCSVENVLGQTLFIPGAGACWRVQLGTGGTLEGDFSDSSCSNDESDWQSTNGVFSIFDSVNQSTNTAIYANGANGYSGSFQFKEDSTVTEPMLEILSWDQSSKVYGLKVTIPTCSTDAICPTTKVNL